MMISLGISAIVGRGAGVDLCWMLSRLPAHACACAYIPKYEIDVLLARHLHGSALRVRLQLTLPSSREDHNFHLISSGQRKVQQGCVFRILLRPCLSEETLMWEHVE